MRACVATRPISARLEPVLSLEGYRHWFTCVAPSHLACRTRAVWQCRPVPSLSGLLAALPHFRDRTALSFDRAAATARRRVLSSRPDMRRLVAHMVIEEGEEMLTASEN